MFLSARLTSSRPARTRPPSHRSQPGRLPHVHQEQGHLHVLPNQATSSHQARTRPCNLQVLLDLVDFLMYGKNNTTFTSFSAWSTSHVQQDQGHLHILLCLVYFLTSSKNKATITSWSTSSCPARTRPLSCPSWPGRLLHVQQEQGHLHILLSLIDFLTSSKNNATLMFFSAWSTSSHPARTRARHLHVLLALINFLTSSKNNATPSSRPSCHG